MQLQNCHAERTRTGAAGSRRAREWFGGAVVAVLLVLAAIECPAKSKKAVIPDAIVRAVVAQRGDLFSRCAASAARPVQPADLLTLSPLQLQSRGKPDLLIRGSACLCAASGNCPSWIFRGNNADEYRVLLDAGGIGLLTVSTLRSGANGRYDLRLETVLSADRRLLTVYRFDGVLYRERECSLLPSLSGVPVPVDCSRVDLSAGGEPELRRPAGAPR